MSLDTPLTGAVDWTESGPLVEMTSAEEERRAVLTATVWRNLHGFMEAGSALIEMRDSRLYRSTHPTFATFCAEEFSLTRSGAYELMAAAEVVSGIPDTGPRPENIGQALALVAVAPEDRAKVITDVAASGKVTAKAIEAHPKHPKPKPEVDRSRCSTCKAPAFLLIEGLCIACAEKAAADDDRCLKCGEITPDATGGSCNACLEASEAPKAKPIRPRPPTAEERAEKEAQQRREDNTEGMARSVATIQALLMVPNGAEIVLDGWQPDIAARWVQLFPEVLTPDGLREVARMLDHFADTWEAR